MNKKTLGTIILILVPIITFFCLPLIAIFVGKMFFKEPTYWRMIIMGLVIMATIVVPIGGIVAGIELSIYD